MNINNPCIKIKKSINKDDYNNIRTLKRICDYHDKTMLKLELDYKLNNKLYKTQFNEYMYFDGDNLVAYIGLCQFNSEEVEVNGMVHPDYRRMKLFTTLFHFVINEWRKREVSSLVLLTDSLSISGIEFIKQTESRYKNSEYEMELTKNIDIECNNIILVEAKNSDALEIAKQNQMFFGYDTDVLESPKADDTIGKYSYIAKLNEKTIGKVRIEITNKLGYIYGLGVLPEYRNNGYGKEILSLAINEMKNKDVEIIKLQVLVDNDRALNLYKKCGFTVTSTIDYFEIKKI